MDVLQEITSFVSVGWLYAWRWIAAVTLGAVEGLNIGLLLTGGVPFFFGIINVVGGVVIISLFSIVYYLERKAGVGK